MIKITITKAKPKFIDFMFKNNMVIYHNPYYEDFYDPIDNDISLRYEFADITALIKDEGNHYDVYVRYKGNRENIGYVPKTREYNTNIVHTIHVYGGKAYEIKEVYDKEENETKIKVVNQIWIPYEFYIDLK